jgi:hypothetical protein
MVCRCQQLAQTALELCERKLESTSRTGHLRTLQEMIGPRPQDRTWREEWVRMRAETKFLEGDTATIDEDYVRPILVVQSHPIKSRPIPSRPIPSHRRCESIRRSSSVERR